jgi:hypothetical protein
MATSKQPRFPNPPLEWGVPQYPTPNVPDFYTKDGHIILVEKVSAEKGAYNPQPLDGSITYDKRDANKWPSTLYLVYQKPDETGQFVYNYYANDRTLASQDPWNYNIQYSEENPSYPVYTRTYLVPRSQYTTVAIGATDPVFGGNAVIVKQAMAELEDGNPLRSRYVQVQRVYETIPGPVLTGKQYDADLGLVVTNTKQIISSSASPYSVTNGTIAYRDEPIDSNKSARIISSISSLPATRTEYKTGAYASPNLVTGFDVSAPQMPNWDINVSVTPVMRAKRSYQTVFKHITSYQYGQPTPSYALFDPVAINVYYDGYFFKVNIPDALTNSGLSITFTTASNDPVHGYINETYDVPVSSTTADQYNALVGTYQLIAFEADYWKANIWRVVQQFVLLK